MASLYANNIYFILSQLPFIGAAARILSRGVKEEHTSV